MIDEEAALKQLEATPMGETKKNVLRQLIKQKAAYDRLLYVKGKEDLYIFNKHVLGIEQGKVELAHFHKKLCRFVTDDKHKKKLILVPRGHLKSTLITIGYSVQSIVNNPNVRILILNATWQMSVDFLSEIKKNLTSNPKLIELYGNLAVEPEEWSQDRITLKRTDMNIKGPTVWATGVESNLVGSHPDVIIFDDVHNRDNINSREQIDKVILRYKDALDLLEPGGQLIIIGTRWADGDLYSWLMDREGEIHQSYDVLIEKAYEGDIVSGEGFTPLWPEKFNLQEFRTRLREKGWYEFSAQYMNNPVPDEDAEFKKEWFQYYDVEEVKGKEMKNFVTIDPAISLAKGADYTAVTTTGIDQFGNIFIKDITRGHFKVPEIIDTIFKVHETWHPQLIILETIAYQKALAYALREEMQKRGRYLPIQEVNWHDKTKMQRIKALQPLYMNKKIFHPKNHEMTPYLEEELMRFPRGRHDDIIDSLSMHLDFLVKPKAKRDRYHKSYLY